MCPIQWCLPPPSQMPQSVKNWPVWPVSSSSLHASSYSDCTKHDWHYPFKANLSLQTITFQNQLYMNKLPFNPQFLNSTPRKARASQIVNRRDIAFMSPLLTDIELFLQIREQIVICTGFVLLWTVGGVVWMCDISFLCKNTHQCTVRSKALKRQYYTLSCPRNMVPP